MRRLASFAMILWWLAFACIASVVTAQYGCKPPTSYAAARKSASTMLATFEVSVSHVHERLLRRELEGKGIGRVSLALERLLASISLSLSLENQVAREV